MPGCPGRSVKPHPCFAALYTPLTSWAERHLLGRLRQNLVGAARGRVLEVGVGTGANFPFYRQIDSLIATEPDTAMLRRARRRARRLGFAVGFQQCPAEALPFGDAAFDTVVITLVLCSVVDQAQALAEARRVLRPNGTLLFIEHVRSDDHRAARLQDLLTPAWRRLSGDCRLNRPTLERIREAGLTIDERQLQFFGNVLFPMVVGSAHLSPSVTRNWSPGEAATV